MSSGSDVDLDYLEKEYDRDESYLTKNTLNMFSGYMEGFEKDLYKEVKEHAEKTILPEYETEKKRFQFTEEKAKQSDVFEELSDDDDIERLDSADYNEIEKHDAFIENNQQIIEINKPLINSDSRTIELAVNESSFKILSLINNQFTKDEIIEIEEEREALGLNPLYKCEGIPGHLEDSKYICFEIIKDMSKMENCVKIIHHWCRTQVFPDAKIEIENRYIALNILLSYPDFSIYTKVGFMFFDSFSKLSEQYNLKPHYSINKYRFSIPHTFLDKVHSKEKMIMKFLMKMCFYAPQNKTGISAEILHYAHNNLLNEYSFIFRKNLVLALIFYRLRNVTSDRKIFETFQKTFYNIFIYISYIIYTKKHIHPVDPAINIFVKNICDVILDKNLFTKMLHNSRNVFNEI